MISLLLRQHFYSSPIPVQLFVMVGVAGLDVLLPAVEDRLAGQQLGEDTPNSPNIYCLEKQNI